MQFINLPKLKKIGQRNMTLYVLNPPQRSKGIIHALNTNSSVNGACTIKCCQGLIKWKIIVTSFSLKCSKRELIYATKDNLN